MTYLLEKFAGRRTFFRFLFGSYVTLAFFRAWFGAGAAHADSIVTDTVHDVFNQSHTDNPYMGNMFAGGCGGSSSSYSQSSYTYKTTFTQAASTTATFTVNGNLNKGGGTFVIDHPLDPKNKLLYHSFVESPDVKNLYDGVVALDGKGEATVTLPDYFMALNQDFRYQLKSIGQPQPNLHVKKEIADNAFAITGGVAGGRVSWQVTGIRHDAYILANPIIQEVKKGPSALVNVGEYLHPGIYPDWPLAGVTSTLGQLWNGFMQRFFGGSA